MDTDAFGRFVSGTGSTPTPFGCAGGFGYQADASGLMLLGHRYYDASTGRFLSRDPIHDGYNWYAYCGNDPVNWVDPEGFVAAALVLGGLGLTFTAPAWVPVVIVVAVVGFIAWIAWDIWHSQGSIVGTPGSTVAIDDPGKPGHGKIRTYGPDGYPIKDIDFGHDHGFGDPHAHDWSRPIIDPSQPHKNRGRGRPLRPDE
ncbi:MAG: RHS repeat-associated core domain-containing protein [Capsulimonadales bacterium]|nr:RHS repeat-associated core domain-containing protein [Capsulimonadales bacterium]